MTSTISIASLTAKSFIPLTTLFVPPDSCSLGEWTLSSTSTSGGFTSIYQHDAGATNFLRTCYPPSAYESDTSYSPGMCPYGFTTAYSTVIDESVTSAQCCPTSYEGFGYDGRIGYCYSSYSTSTSVACLPSTGTVPTGCMAGPGVALTFAVFLRYEATDLSLFPAQYTPGIPFVEIDTRTSLATRTSSTVPHRTGTPSPNTSGISTGAKVGIGVGVVVGASIIVSSIILFCCHRKRQERNQSNDAFVSDLPEAVATKNERSGTPVVLKKHNRGLENRDPVLDAMSMSLDQPSSSSNKFTSPGGTNSYTGPVAHQYSSTRPTLKEQSTPQAVTYGSHEAHSGFASSSMGEAGPPTQQSSFPHMYNSDKHDFPSRCDPIYPHSGAPPQNHVQELPNSLSQEQARLPTESQSNASELGKPKEEMTAADWELKYLESEERRIRERKEALLRSQSP